MANEKQQALERELFNMKMRCHQYEVRLAEVNLHGATGEQIQMQNLELKEKVAALEEESAIRAQQMQEMHDVWTSSKEAIKALQEDIVSKKETIVIAESELNRLDIQVQDLETENSTLATKYSEACELFKAREAELEQELVSKKHSCECLQVRVQTATDEITQMKRKAELDSLKIEQLNERVGHLQQFEAKCNNLQGELDTAMEFKAQAEELASKAEKLEIELAETRDKMQKESEETIAVEAEKLTLESETIRREMQRVQTQLEHQLQLTKEQYDAKELECKRLRLRSEQYMTLEENARKDLACMHAELSNAKEHERMVVEGVEQQKQDELDHIRQEATQQLETVRQEFQAKLKSRDKTISQLEEKVKHLKYLYDEVHVSFEAEKQKLQEENEKIRAKWRNSIAGKKASPSVPTKTRKSLGTSKPFAAYSANIEKNFDKVKPKRTPLGLHDTNISKVLVSPKIVQKPRVSNALTPISSVKKRSTTARLRKPGSSSKKKSPVGRSAGKIRGRLTNPAALRQGKKSSPITSSIQFR